MSFWDIKIGGFRPVYALGLWYLRHAPWDFLKEYIRHGVVGHTPRFTRFVNKDGIVFDLDVHECVQKAIFCFHYFEPEDVAAFRRFIRPGSVVLDVGANIGQYALLASRLMEGSGQVYAFEPSPEIRKKLKNNIRLNAFENIVVVPCAVAATKGKMKFYPASEQGNQGVGSLMPAEEYRASIRSEHAIEVDVLTLNDFCKDRGIPRVDVLKIDVEGYDLEVLKGATALLENNPHMIVMSEVEPINLAQLGATAEDFYRFMRSFGFYPWYAEKGGRLKRLHTESPPYHPNVFFLHQQHHDQG